MTRPYRGGTTETSNLDRILELMPNSQLSSLNPPPDMSTRTDIAGGLLLPREQPKESKPWYWAGDLPEWEGTLPGGPQDAAYQLSELRADMTPGEGQYRSAKRSAAETAKATDLFKQGKYLEAIPPTIWAGVEGLDAAASGLGVIGAAATLPLDAARGVKRLMTASAKKQEAIINHGVRNLPTLRKAINQSRKEKHLIPDRSKGANGQFVGAPRGIRSKTQIKKMRAEFDAQVAGGVLGADWYQRVRKFTGDISGGSKEAENRLAEAFALFSAQANPVTNMNWTFQALNNWAAVIPVSLNSL